MEATFTLIKKDIKGNKEPLNPNYIITQGLKPEKAEKLSFVHTQNLKLSSSTIINLMWQGPW